jgi:uncharacterized phage protein (TIGR01671 family)
MREIKFRGKTLSGKWVYGDLVHFTNTEGVDTSVIITGHQATAESDDFDYALCYARNEFKIVIPKSVGQFTGLHDKNGKEIYEGDVITQYLVFQNGKHYECKARGGQVVFDKLWGFVLLSESRLYHLFGDGLTQEVQGNIHDNPELLKTE